MIEKSVLVELISQKHSGSKIASRLGCSRQAVDYWERKYGLRPAFPRRGGDTRIESPEEMTARMAHQSVVFRRRLKARAITYKGGKCLLCGYDRYNGAVEFHHLDKTTKGFGLSRKGIVRSWESIRSELEKCVLVCSNCHREIEGGQRTIPKGLAAQPNGEKKGPSGSSTGPIVDASRLNEP